MADATTETRVAAAQMALPLTLPPANPAEAAVVACMSAALPPGVPLAFTVERAHCEGRGARRRAVAEVRMFDGGAARVAVWRESRGGFPMWVHQWLAMDGGPVSWEEGQWVRYPREAS